MSRFFSWAFVALITLSVSAALGIGCSDDEQEQQQAAQQQQSESAAESRTRAAQDQQQQDPPAADEGEPLNVVVSTQVIADWVRQIGGDRVSVRALVPAGADAHTIELSVTDIRAVADADLVIINGAGLEASYEDAILENADHVLNLAEAIEEAGFELAPFGATEMAHDDHDDHDDHGDEEMHDDDHGSAEAIGRLLIADAIEAHLSVIDLSTEEVNSGLFSIAAPGARVLPSPTHRYGFVLARGA